MPGSAEQVWELDLPLAKTVNLGRSSVNSSLCTNAALESGRAAGQGMDVCWGMNGLAGAAMHCVLPPAERTAHRPNPALGRRKLGDLVQDPVLVVSGMFCQEHPCTTHAPHSPPWLYLLCGQSVTGCVHPSLLSRGCPRGEEETRARG